MYNHNYKRKRDVSQIVYGNYLLNLPDIKLGERDVVIHLNIFLLLPKKNDINERKIKKHSTIVTCVSEVSRGIEKAKEVAENLSKGYIYMRKNGSRQTTFWAYDRNAFAERVKKTNKN